MAKKSLMEKFKKFVEGSAESNAPMTGREIAKTKARKKEGHRRKTCSSFEAGKKNHEKINEEAFEKEGGEEVKAVIASTFGIILGTARSKACGV
jgi:hypothetical protein